MQVYDRACEHILTKMAHKHAQEWLAESNPQRPRVIGGLDTDDSIYVVETAKARGADKIEVFGPSKVIEGYGSADGIVITLPDSLALREQLFDFERAVAKESGFYPSVDEGQRYLMLRWR